MAAAPKLVVCHCIAMKSSSEFGMYRRIAVVEKGDCDAGRGPKFALGLGVVSSPKTSYEQIYAGGIQAVAHRTWPWGSPFLPSSTTYVGVEVFGHVFAFRCSAGVMWRRSGNVIVRSSAIPIVGCGIGLP